MHNCKFCCVDKNLIEYNNADIFKQAESFKGLEFKLVYINDKTFGQACNYKRLKEVKYIIKQYNPAFKGFIVQTTAAKCKDLGFCKELRRLGVRVVEIGVETFNDSLLREYRKPHNEKMIRASFDNLDTARLKIIPNILIGLIGEDRGSYQNTLDFLEPKNIYSLNIYNLAIYADTDLAKEIKSTKHDTNELEPFKSYHTKNDMLAIDYFYNEIFNLGLDILKGK